MLSQDLSDPVVQLDALLFILNSLLRDACSRLSTEGRAACQIALHFTLEQGLQTLSMQLGEPTRSPTRILSLLRNRLERFELAGPVTALALEVSESAPFDGRQAGLMDRGRRTEAIADVTSRLQDSLGRSRVSIPELQSHHRPETSWRAHPIRAAALDSPRTTAQSLARTEARILEQDPVHHWKGRPIHPLPPRPPLVLHAPLSIDVQTPPEGIPLSVQVDGSWMEIIASSGPERINTEWWMHSQGHLNREYWRVQLADGRSAWIYKEDGRWALHGWWDR
jgi:protein ImuB